MQYRKTLFICLIAALTPAMRLQAQQIIITDPVQYNEFIVGQQNAIGNELLVLIDMFNALPEDKTPVIEQLEKVLTAGRNAMRNTLMLEPIGNEFGLRQAAMYLFGFYVAALDKEYRELIDNIYAATPDVDLLSTIMDTVEQREAKVDADFQSAQQQFAAFYNIQLEENELQDSIDGATDDGE